MKRRRGKIVAVGIMIVIVLLSGRGGSLEWICAARGRGGDTNSLEWIPCSLWWMVIFSLLLCEWNVIGGILIPLDESGIINSYTILFGVNCIFFHNCFNSLLSFLCRLQVVLCHLLFFCGERTAPKIMPHIFVASPKIDIQRIPKMAINMLS